MTVDYSDVLAARAEKAAAVAAVRQTHRETLQAVAVRLEDLLTDDAWGVYTTLLEQTRATAQAQLDALQEQILGDAVGEDLIRLKLHAAYCRGELEAFRVALALPAQVHAQAAAEGAA